MCVMILVEVDCLLCNELCDLGGGDSFIFFQFSVVLIELVVEDECVCIDLLCYDQMWDELCVLVLFIEFVDFDVLISWVQ